MKENKFDCFKQLASLVKPSGTIAHIPRDFLRGLKTFLGWSDGNISVVLGVSRPAINRKINAAEKEPVTAPPADDQEEATILEDFMNARLTPEDELKFLNAYGRRMLETLPHKSQARMTLYKLLIESSEKKVKEEAEEGNELLRAFLNEVKEAFSEAREKMQVEFKKEITRMTTLFLDELTTNPSRDPISIRDAFLLQLEVFDTGSLIKNVFLSKPNLKRKMDEYVARQEDAKPPSLVGGGVVSRQGEGSEIGGGQYRQKAREEQRERDAKRTPRGDTQV